MKTPTLFCLLPWASLLLVQQIRDVHALQLVPSCSGGRRRCFTATPGPTAPSFPSRQHQLERDAETPKDWQREKRSLVVQFLDSAAADVVPDDGEDAAPTAGTTSSASAEDASIDAPFPNPVVGVVVDEKVLAGRKRRLRLTYRASSLVSLTASLLHLLLLVDRGGGVHGSSSSLLYDVFGGGMFTLAVVTSVLAGAASHDRLSSDTYKRLNLAVLVSALLQLLPPLVGGGGAAAAAAALGSPSSAWSSGLRQLLRLPALLMALVGAIKGYGYGVLGWDKSNNGRGVFVTDLRGGIRSTVRCLTTVVRAKPSSMGYLFGTLLLGSLALVTGCEMLFRSFLHFSSSSSSTAAAGGIGGAATTAAAAAAATSSMGGFSRLSIRASRLWLMASVFLTLKDASDRDRLGGTTFVHLNYVSAAAAFATMLAAAAASSHPSSSVPLLGVAVLRRTAPSALSGEEGWTAPLFTAVAAGALAALSLYNGTTNAKWGGKIKSSM
jgi:hypothetical protein